MNTKPQRNRVSVVVIHNNKILGFHAEDPHSKKRYFFLPGGLIESGESVAEAAKREAFEETGYQINVLDDILIKRRYDFEWNGQINDCETKYLAGRLINDVASDVKDAAYNLGAGWAPISEMRTIFGYHKDILEPLTLITEQLLKMPHKPE